jgi:hypothetical protein
MIYQLRNDLKENRLQRNFGLDVDIMQLSIEYIKSILNTDIEDTTVYCKCKFPPYLYSKAYYEDIRAKELIYENRPYPRTVIQPKLLENIIYQEREVALPIRKDSIKTNFRS